MMTSLIGNVSLITARECSANDCEEGVGVKGLELTNKQVEKVKEHGTLLLPDNHYFVKDEILVIDGQPEFKYYPKPGGASGKKKAVMIRVTAEDDEPSHSMKDLQARYVWRLVCPIRRL
jgi:hypothetical protein